jgi:hypothetical protein
VVSDFLPKKKLDAPMGVRIYFPHIYLMRKVWLTHIFGERKSVKKLSKISNKLNFLV